MTRLPVLLAGVILGCHGDREVASKAEDGSGTGDDAAGATVSADDESMTPGDEATGADAESSTGADPPPGAATVWEVSLAREGSWVSPCDVAVAPDGSFAISAAVVPKQQGGLLSGFIAWFAPNGTLVRERILSDSILSSIDFDDNGVLWGIGNGQNPYSGTYGPDDDETTWGTWLALDPEGEVLWAVEDPRRSIGTDGCDLVGFDEPKGVIRTHEGGALIYRYDFELDPEPFHQEVMRIDEAGAPQWSVRFLRNPPHLGRNVAWIDGETYVAGNVETGDPAPLDATAWLSRVDPDGAIAWERSVEHRESVMVIAGNDGELYWLVSEYGSAVAEPDQTLARLDPETGETLWTKPLPYGGLIARNDAILQASDLWVVAVEISTDPPGADPGIERHPGDGDATEVLPLDRAPEQLFVTKMFAGPGEDVLLTGRAFDRLDDDARVWLARVELP